MKLWKKMGPDGFQVGFFQSHQTLVDQNICEEVNQVLQGHQLDESLNSTLIWFIQKIPGSMSFKHFRPISLCIVTYKIITKVIANQIKKNVHLFSLSQTNQPYVMYCCSRGYSSYKEETREKGLFGYESGLGESL